MSKIEEIRAREQAATAAPWNPHETHNLFIMSNERQIADLNGGAIQYIPDNRHNDAQFISHARKDIPYLLSEHDRLTAELEQYRQAKAKLSINCIVYAVIKCGDITMLFDNDYEHGTGAVECPFESQCNFGDCDDEQSQILETTVSGILTNEDGFTFWLKDVGYGGLSYSEHDIGKTVFFSREEAKKAQEEQQ